MHVAQRFLPCLLAIGAATSPAFTQSGEQLEAPRWCEYAKHYLSRHNGMEFDCRASKIRCIKMNNYGCSQNHGTVPYPGQLRTRAGQPVTDGQRHALYEHPKWSVHKTIATLLRYYSRGKKTPLAIAETYAPWCDTRGSRQLNGGWGRTCSDGLPSVPTSFTGPRCARPSGSPTRAQCEHCNCPSAIAEFYIRGTGGRITDPVQLFDENGKPSAPMRRFLKQIITLETGYVPSEGLVTEAIESFGP